MPKITHKVDAKTTENEIKSLIFELDEEVEAELEKLENKGMEGTVKKYLQKSFEPKPSITKVIKSAEVFDLKMKQIENIDRYNKNNANNLSARSQLLIKIIEEDLSTLSKVQRIIKLMDDKKILDPIREKIYNNDPPHVLRLKLLALSLGTCTLNLIALLAMTTYRLAKIIALYELRNPNATGLEKIKDYCKDIAKVVFGPLFLLAMQTVSTLGVIIPYENGPRNAAKMYVDAENIIFGKKWTLAPGLHPTELRDVSELNLETLHKQLRDHVKAEKNKHIGGNF